jgi:hypothetical protein
MWEPTVDLVVYLHRTTLTLENVYRRMPTRPNVHISLPALMNVLDVCQLAYVPGPNKYDAMPGVRLTRETMPKHSIGHRIPVRYFQWIYNSD